MKDFIFTESQLKTITMVTGCTSVDFTFEEREDIRKSLKAEVEKHKQKKGKKKEKVGIIFNFNKD